MTSAQSQREARIEALGAALTLEEKVWMLSGHGFLEQMKAGTRYCGELHQVAAGNPRLGIAPLQFLDGPRGVAMGSSTCFPVPMARGASFDVELEERVGEAIGRELRAHGANLFGGVCINLLRHPAWGRAQETYGEDPFLLGEMGAALVTGVQRHNVVATPKHFAANSMENARFKVDVELDERALREVYLPHFKRCIDAGAGAVMSAYNQLNGAYCGHNRDLLTTILKEQWGFDGFVYSDFVLGCRGWDACAAGLDVEAPDTIQFGDKLRVAVERGDVDRARIDDAVARVLRSLLRTLERPDPQSYSAALIACPEHVALAREAAEKSIVLLRNEDLLPLDETKLHRLLVLGALADEPNLGDHGSSRVYPPTVVTPLAALEDTGVAVVYDPGENLERVRELAAEADAVLVVAGYDHRHEGEFIPEGMASGGEPIGGDRLDLSLGADSEALILAAAEANAKTIVAIMAGSAVLVESWRERAGAILLLWYPGMEGGRALADVLFGRVNPSGRLPFTMVERAEHLPFFDRDADEIRYDLWHGYTRLEREGIEPAYPFGFGLSYSEFVFSDASARVDETQDRLDVSVEVRNVSERAGTAVVQVYAGWQQPAGDQPRKRLCGFTRVNLAHGERRRVEVAIDLAQLAYFEVARRRWELGSRAWRVWVGPSSDASACLETKLELPERSWSIRER